MRYMALDVGDKRVGVAISDEMGMASLPHSVIERSSDAEVLQRVTDIINQYKIDVLVVGNPINLDGTAGARSKKTEQFYNYVKKRINIKSLMFDERLTTLAAQRILLDADVSRKKRKEVIDKLAAQQILYSYIEYTKKEKE